MTAAEAGASAATDGGGGDGDGDGDAGNPYVGPRAFKPGEALYGRNRERDRLLDLFIADRIVLLHSPSGAGKTSLVQAGLLPTLDERGFNVLPVTRVTAPDPGPQCLPGVTNPYIRSVLACLGVEDAPAATDLTGYLERRPRPPDRPNDVIVFDQFEELVLDREDIAAKREFMHAVGRALADGSRWALFVIREDYLGALAPFRPFVPHLVTTFRLDFLDIDGATAAAERPAAERGVEFAPEASTQLIDDLRRIRVRLPGGSLGWRPGDYVEGMFLQVVCYRLWERLGGARLIERAHLLDKTGDAGVDRALADFYGERVGAFARDRGSDERMVRDWFEYDLVKENVRAQVIDGPFEAPERDAEAIHAFDGTLIRQETRRGTTWIELAHDRLIAPVAMSNREWREATLTRFQRQASLWAQARTDALALTGPAFAEAEKWAREHDATLLPEERAFLETCRRVRDRDRRARRLSGAVKVLAGLVAVALVAALLATRSSLQNSRHAKQREHLSQALGLVADARANRLVDPSLSALLALKAVEVAGDGLWREAVEARTALYETVYQDGARPRFTLPDRAVNDVVFAGEELLVTAGRDGTAVVWNTGGHEDFRLPQNPNFAVARVAATSDGAVVAIGSGDGTVTVTDRVRGTLPLIVHADGKDVQASSRAITSLALNATGTRLASAGAEGTAKVWDLTSATSLPLMRIDSGATDVALNGDGTLLAVAEELGTVEVFDVPSGALRFRSRHAEATAVDIDARTPVRSVAFSPDGTRLATAGDDRTAAVWDVTSVAAGLVRVATVRHRGAVNRVAFSPDGRRFATAGQDDLAAVWDSTTGESVSTIAPQTGAVRSVAFSPDGTVLSVATENGAPAVWDVVPAPASGHTGPVLAVDVSPDGGVVATASADGTARLWDALSGTELRVLRGHLGPVTSVVFSPDGALLATGGADLTVRLWNVSTGAVREVASGLRGSVSAMTYLADGRVLVGSADGAVRVFDPSTGALSEIFRTASRVSGVSVSADGRIATGADNGTVTLWNGTGQVLGVLTGHTAAVTDVTFAPGGARLASASADQTVRLWEVGSGRELLTLKGHGGPVNDVAFSPDGQRLATASADGSAKVWDAASGADLLTFRGHNSVVNDVAFTGDGRRLVTAGGDDTAKIWDASSAVPLLTLPPPPSRHQGTVNAVVFAPELTGPTGAGGERVITASDDGTVIVRDAATGQERMTLKGHDRPVRAVAVDEATGTRLVTGSDDGTVRVWDLVSGRELFAPLGVGTPVLSLAITPGGRIAAGAADGSVHIWSAGGAESLRVPRQDGPVRTLAFNPDGTRLATASGDTVKVWDTSDDSVSASAVAPLVGSRRHPVTVDGVVLGSGGVVASVADGRVRLGAITARKPTEFDGPGVRALALSHDGSYLAGVGDGEIRVWRVGTTVPYIRIPARLGARSVSFSYDGEQLAVAGGELDYRAFLLNPSALRAAAEPLPGRSLSPAECERYLAEKC